LFKTSRSLPRAPGRGRLRSVFFCLGGSLIAFAACSVFEIPAGGFRDEVRGGSGNTGGSGGAVASGGTSGGSDGASGSGGAAGSAGRQGSGGVGGNDGGDGSATGGTGGGATGVPWWPYENTHGCQSAGLPTQLDRPPEGDPGASLPPIYLVISRMRLGTANDDAALTPNVDAWRDIGFDLDKRCTNSFTCEDQNQDLIYEAACKHPQAQIPYDGNQCRDNEIAKLFKLASTSPSIGEWFGMTEADWNCELHRGGFGDMIKISDYNGKAHDRQVRVDIYHTLGLRQPPSWTCRSAIDAPLNPSWSSHGPWRADERWRIADSSISLSAPDAGNELPDAKIYDPSAFVRNGILFAKLPENSELGLFGKYTRVPGFSIYLYRGILVGQLVKLPDGTWTIDKATLGGVARPDQLLESFQEFGFCENLCTTYDVVRDYLNTYRDALTNTADILPDTPCDGLSFAEAFTARQATAVPQDIEPYTRPPRCGQPRHPEAPRQGCICPVGGGRCELPDGGS
jgi:hypothetical protein